MSQITTLHIHISRARNYVEYKELLSMEVGFSDHRLRVLIKTDGADGQSSAVIEVWSNNDKQWNIVDYIHYSRMETTKFSSKAPDKFTERDFTADRTDLVQHARAILK